MGLVKSIAPDDKKDTVCCVEEYHISSQSAAVNALTACILKSGMPTKVA